MLAIRPDECSVCGVEFVTAITTQLALLIHGMYGAYRRDTVKICDCAVRIMSTESINPRNPRTVPPDV